MHELTQKEYQELLLEHSDFHHKLDDLDKRLTQCESQQGAINALTLSVDRLTITMKNMVEQQKDIKSEVKALKEAPAEDYKHYKRTIISCIITTVVGTLIGALLVLIIK